MPRITTDPTSEMAILRRVVDSDQPVFSAEAARATPAIAVQRIGQGADESASRQEPSRQVEDRRGGRARQLHSRGPDVRNSAIEGPAVIEGDPRVSIW